MGDTKPSDNRFVIGIYGIDQNGHVDWDKIRYDHKYSRWEDRYGEKVSSPDKWVDLNEVWEGVEK